MIVLTVALTMAVVFYMVGALVTFMILSVSDSTVRHPTIISFGKALIWPILAIKVKTQPFSQGDFYAKTRFLVSDWSDFLVDDGALDTGGVGPMCELYGRNVLPARGCDSRC